MVADCGEGIKELLLFFNKKDIFSDPFFDPSPNIAHLVKDAVFTVSGLLLGIHAPAFLPLIAGCLYYQIGHLLLLRIKDG